MKLEKYIQENKLKSLNEYFVRYIFYPEYGEEGLDMLVSENPIRSDDGATTYYIDFTINTKLKKYAIECDGLYYHAEGAVTNEYFNRLQEKQNTILAKGYDLIRFTNNLVRNEPQKVTWELRRRFIADEQLYKLFLKRNKGVTPHEVQQEALDALEQNREEGHKKGIVIMATGLGKTYLSAFDVKNFHAKKALFIVHINDVLKSALNSFQNVLPDKANNMALYNGENREITGKDIIFASIQTLSRDNNLTKFSPNEFEYIILDETHHIAAPTYKKVFEYFNPRFFLGLTATPFRTDDADVPSYYKNNIVYEIDQSEAIKRGLLVPYKYFGFKDDVDYTNIYYSGFRYDVDDLNKSLMIERRDTAVINRFKEMVGDRKTIGFCVSIEHADWCAEKFREQGIKAEAIHSKLDNPIVEIDEDKEKTLIDRFRDDEFQVAFVVNMFNEGIDIPDVECLLFLRPTESKTVFIQQMGRGLRISPEKENVLILDFIGNYRTAGNILTGLNIKDPSGLEKRVIKEGKEQKVVYFYDNNGCQVQFDEEVVDVFKKLRADSTTTIREDLIESQWLEYADYLNKWTENNLYWKTTKQNRWFETQMEGLNILAENRNIDSDMFIEEIQNIVESKYPGKNMSAKAFRSLFISKITGFLDSSPTDNFYEVLAKTKGNFQDLDSYKYIISRQIEKLFYWNQIYGSVNRYSTEQVNYWDFEIYPIFFIYEILMKMEEEYGFENPRITFNEFNYFVSVTKTQEDANRVIEQIIEYRNHEEKYELAKVLNEACHIDQRFIYLIIYSDFLGLTRDKDVIIKQGKKQELHERVKRFLELQSSDKLITPVKNFDKYKEMLLSTKDIFDFHKF